MTTQSIIVYRNPLEAAIWESGLFGPLVGGISVGFFVFLIGMMILDKASGKNYHKPKWFDYSVYTLAVISLVIAFYVFDHLAN